MLLLLVAFGACFLLVVLLLREFRRGRLYGSYSWFSIMLLTTVMPGFVVNYVESGAPPVGPPELALRVVTLSAVCFGAVGLWLQGRSDQPETVRVSVDWSGASGRFWVFAFVILAPAWLYFALLGSIPLFTAGLGDGGSLQEARIARDPYHNVNQAKIPLAGLLESFRNIGVPALAAAAWIRYRTTKSKALLFVFAFSVVTVLAAGQRWPLQYLLLTTLIALLAVSKTPQTAKRLIVRVALIGLSFGALVTIWQGRTGVVVGASFGEQFQGGLAALLERVSYGYVQVPIMAYDGLSYLGVPLMGQSYLQTLWAFAPGPGESYAVTFYNSVLRMNSGFTASPDFGTELFLNFLWWGVIIGSSLWAALLGAFDRRLFRRAYVRPEELGLIAMVVLSLAATTTEGLVGASMRTVFILIPTWLAMRTYDAAIHSLRGREREAEASSAKGEGVNRTPPHANRY